MSKIDDVVKRVGETRHVGLVVMFDEMSSDDSAVVAMWNAYDAAKEILEKTDVRPTIVPIVREYIEEGELIEVVVRPLRISDISDSN